VSEAEGRDRVGDLEALARLLTRDVETQARLITDQREETVAMLAEVLDRLDTLEGSDTEPARPRVPRPWAARATPEDWSQLTDWVDWLISSYSLRERHLVPGCWQAHPGAVEDLAALHAAWRHAMLAEEAARDTGSDTGTYWHQHHLFPALDRIRALYATHDCIDTHHPEPDRPGRHTDRTALSRPGTPDKPPRSTPTPR
jgi:hypothetical protein